MVTGASTADVALVLVDARTGIVEQSRRHASIAVAARHPPPDRVREQDGSRRLGRGALPRDRVRLRRDGRAARDRATRARSRCRRSTATTSSTPPSATPWFDGEPLLAQLEQLEVAEDRNLEDVRFPVQLTIRDTDYRGYAGRVAGGVLRTGDEVSSCRPGRRRRSRASTRRAGRSSRSSRRWRRRSCSPTSSTSAAAT